MRRIFGIIVLLLLGFALVACGTDEEDPEPTPEPPPAVETEPTVDANIEIPATPGVDVTEENGTLDPAESNGTPEPMAEEATPEAEVDMAASPEVADEHAPAMVVMTPAVATPAPTTTATPAATPEATPAVGGAIDVDRPDMGTPVATPSGTPEATPVASPVDESGMIVPSDVQEESRAPISAELSGTIELAGAQNETYVMTDEGCVGLGQYSDLRDGRQVVVRNEAGVILSVTEMDAVRDGETCAWNFVVQVPESDFYSVSVPMVFERVFPKAQVAENEGDVVIQLP